VESAVEAIKEGAYDYLTKPIEPQRLKILLDKIVERHDTLREVKVLRRQLREQGSFGSMIGSSPSMRKVYQIVEQAAPTSASVLIWGESGTGKELVAKTIHQLSPRAQQPFVPINCAAIPETLLESEIFGPREGRVHRRDRSARRMLRAGRSRHAVPRRDCRDDAGDAGEAPARAAGADVPAARAAATNRPSTSA
jgi:DNA-binding NtrC family response regulator